MTALAFWADTPADEHDRALAGHLGISIFNEPQEQGLYLARRDDHLVLGRFNSPEKPISVEFAAGDRRQRGRELLVKALGGGMPRPSVLDATAGLGRDAFIMASHGYPVTMLEREPVLVVLLEDGLRRAATDAQLGEIVGRMNLQAADAREYLRAASPGSVDVIYLDPMFGDSGKSARVKKDLRLLQELLPAEEPSGELLELALKVARYRVVVKRGIKAAPLDGRQPSVAIKGKAVRFDVYALRSFNAKD